MTAWVPLREHKRSIVRPGLRGVNTCDSQGLSELWPAPKTRSRPGRQARHRHRGSGRDPVTTIEPQPSLRSGSIAGFHGLFEPDIAPRQTGFSPARTESHRIHPAIPKRGGGNIIGDRIVRRESFIAPTTDPAAHIRAPCRTPAGFAATASRPVRNRPKERNINIISRFSFRIGLAHSLFPTRNSNF